MKKLSLPLALILLLGLTNTGVAEATTQMVFKGRVVNIYTPNGTIPYVPKGLVILLHGYGGTGKQIDNYLQFRTIAKQVGLIYATVEGTKDGSGKQFWSATSSCCNFTKKKIDEVSYFQDLINEIQKENIIDPLRIFIVGHSNGGFMAHSLACSLSPIVAGIISIAGEQSKNPEDCQPSSLVNILQIQGTADLTVPYAGGSLGLTPFPGAEETLKIWATKNRCDLSKYSVLEIPTLVNEKSSVPSLSKSFEGCPIGGSSELWAIPGAGHVPIFNLQATQQMAIWLQTHPKLEKKISN
jgi:polyhydroxybutyrate depolymerase